MFRYNPALIEDYFASGMEEHISPFLTPGSRKWASNLTVKSSVFAAFLLTLAFIVRWFNMEVANLLLLFVYFFAGIPALIETVEDLKEFRVNIDVLMTLAAFLSVLIGSAMEGGLLLVLFSLSGAMEDMVTEKTKGALQALHKLSPTMAQVITDDGTLIEKSVREIALGTQILIKSGEIIPLDGKVVGGDSHVSMVHLTGESVPIAKHVDDEVQAGSMNMDGTLTVEVTIVAADSTLSRIIKLITRAQAAKPRLQKFLDRFGQVYAKTIILLSAFFALMLPIGIGVPFLGLEGSIYRALAFLIAASPCALIIATPTAYLSAISACARRGILMKGGVTLDALEKCHTFAFDKTGTLTTGQLEATKIDTHGEAACSQTEALSIAASLERSSTHPIATAIMAYQKQEGAAIIPVKGLRTVAGFGVEGRVEMHGEELEVAIGSFDFIGDKLGRNLREVHDSHAELGHLITYLLVKESIFIFHFLDEVRPKMAEAIADLKKLNIELIMLTGDHSDNASYVGEKVGIEKIHSELRPDEKLGIIEKLSEGGHLAMIGDGINDAPALARATVGISMGEVGSATAIEASDIVFLKDDLNSLSWLLCKAKKTTRIVKQNLTLALGVILLATTPALLGVVPLWLAVILHEGGTIVVAINSLRLLKA
ncbi:MAG: cation-translocating P-type ATPase [Simkaniaceae bacterium]|nr:cation-translocating P-type ATPase [Simkaniaceae bacterium]